MDSFGGQWIDRNQGTFVVAFTDDIAIHQAALDQLLGDDPPDALEVVQVENSERRLVVSTTDLRSEIGLWSGLKSVSTSIQMNSVVAVFGDDPADEVAEAIAALPHWVCHITLANNGPAELRRNDDEELRRVVVQVDPDDFPTPQSQSVSLVLTEMECAAGEAMGDRLRGPIVREKETSVHIEFWVAKQPAQVCRDRYQTEFVVELEQPLGGRRITTTGGATLLGSKAVRQSQLFLNSMVALIDQIRMIEYIDFPLTARTGTSETFSIGQPGLPQFEITGAVRQSEPAGVWTNPVGDSQLYSPIERANGAGVWSLCGDFYLEILSLGGDLEAAEKMFTTLSAGIASCR